MALLTIVLFHDKAKEFQTKEWLLPKRVQAGLSRPNNSAIQINGCHDFDFTISQEV